MNPDQLQQLQLWLESQKAHWQSLLTDGQNPPVDAQKAAADWQTVLDSCRGLANQHNPDQAELAESMAQQIKGFSHYAEQLLDSLQNPESSFNLEQAVDTLSTHLHQQVSEPFYRHLQLPEAMQQPLQQLLQQLGLSPSDYNSFPFLHQGADKQQAQQRQKLLDAAAALTEFSQALQLYSRLQQQISQKTNQQLVEILTDQDNRPETLIELHSLWIDCYEQSYQQQLGRDEYQQAYGRLCNATIALQQQLRHYWQQEQRALGIVPFEDYDKLLRNHHQLRKDHKQSQRSIRQLQQTIEQQHQASEQQRQAIDQQRQASEQQQQQLQALEQRLQRLESCSNQSSDQTSDQAR